MAKLIFSIIFFYLLIVLTAYIFQRSFIYFPNQSSPVFSNWKITDMQEVQVKTIDGLQLLSWYKPAKAGRPTIIYFQGNAGHIGNRSQLVRPYLNQGYGVLLAGYRGYGGNKGTSNEQGLYDDATAAFNFLQKAHVPTRCMVLFGESLGSALVVQLAKEHSVGAIVLLTPFTSMTDLGKYHYPLLPIKFLLKDQFNSLAKISSVKAPLLVILAEKDNIVPMQFGKRLFEAANNPKELLIYPNKGHNDLHQVVQAKVIAFITKYVVCNND